MYKNCVKQDAQKLYNKNCIIQGAQKLHNTGCKLDHVGSVHLNYVRPACMYTCITVTYLTLNAATENSIFIHTTKRS